MYSPKRTIGGYQKPPSRAWAWIKWIVVLVFLIGVGGVLFLKLNTNAAAQFTDNVLRPLLGADRVIALEKLFFNISDEVEQLTYDSKSAEAPQFTDGGDGASAPASDTNLDLTPIQPNAAFTSIPGEGEWKDRPLKAFPQKEVMAYTFVRSDPDRAYSETTLVQLDMKAFNIGLVAGTKEPASAVGKPGPGVVPKDIIDSGNLVAAFDGGFQYKDGAYGMIVGDKTYLPLKNDLGTFVAYKDGSLKITDYQGQSIGSDAIFVRQNCPILIAGGEVSVENPRSKALWGRLAAGTTDIYTWRSGVGINKKGDLVFAVGNNLTPVTLANALKAAGAVDAIQLDINPIWVRFNIFESIGGGKYDSVPLTNQLHDGAKAYLTGYEKDFFYVYKR